MVFGIALLLAGCSNLPALTATVDASATKAISTYTKFIPTVTNTYIPEPSPTTTLPTSTSTVSPKLKPTYLPWPPDRTSAKHILTAFWNEDGTKLYIASTKGDIKPIQWSVYSFEDQSLKLLPKSPIVTRKPNGTDYYYYPELQGKKSPSGRYEIEVLHLPGPSEPSDLNSYFYLIDHRTGNRFTLLEEESSDLVFKGCDWFPDESGGVLALGPSEYGVDLYLLNTITPSATSFAERVGLSDAGNMEEWSLSPEGNTIAIAKPNGSLRIFTLGGDQVLTIDDGISSHLRWQPNGDKLFFYHEPELGVFESINSYDASQGIITAVLDKANLDDVDLLGHYFDVSPDGNTIVMWSGDDIWVFELTKR
jgi:hypothetical protein